MRAGRETGYRDRRSAGPGGGPYSPGSSLGSVRSSSRRAEPSSSSSSSSPNHAFQMQPGGNGAMILPQQMAGSVGSNVIGAGGNTSGSLSTNTAYLSPPLDSSWRRTHSDSALHQATLTPGDTILIGNTSPSMSRRGQHHRGITRCAPLPGTCHVESFLTLLAGQEGSHCLSGTDHSGASVHHGLSVQVDGRPKSCCDVSRVPGIK